MKKIDLDVEERKEAGKGEVGRLRKTGFIPGIVYGDENKSLSIKMDKRNLIRFLRSIGAGNILTNLKIKGEKGVSDQLAILREIQHDPVTDDLVHVDFQRVSLKKRITSEVPIVLKGEPEGVKAGGILDHALRTVEIECLPQDMPERIEVDISGFKIHDSIHVKDLPLPPDVKVITDGARGVLSILPPRKIEVEEVAAPTVAEPEVITEKGKEEAEVAEAGEKGEKAAAAEPQKDKKEEPKGKAEDKKEKKEK